MSGPQPATSSSRAADDLECEICLLPFDTNTHCPRMLKCGHTICEDCAEKLWAKELRRRIKCPFDRIVTTVKDDIKNLPKNFTLERLLDSQKPEISKISITTGRCSKDYSHEAWFTCKECEADFCENCFASTHKKCEKSGKLKPERIPSIDRLYEAKKCKRDPENFADFVCLDPSCNIECKVVCTVCLSEEHKDHKHVPIVQIIAENQKKLKEELIKKPVSEEMEQYLKENNIQNIAEAHIRGHQEYNLQINQISDHYDKQRVQAIRKFEKYAEKKLGMATKVSDEYNNAKETEKSLKNIRQEIRTRLKSKRKLDNVEDLVKRHKMTHEELNRKREITPMVSTLNKVRFKMPTLEMEIIDPDEPIASST